MKNKLKFFRVFHSKKAQMAVAQAIKVITSIVLGALLLTGGSATIKEIVLPNTTSKVESIINFKDDDFNGLEGIGDGSISDNIQNDIFKTGLIIFPNYYTEDDLITEGDSSTPLNNNLKISGAALTVYNDLTVSFKVNPDVAEEFDNLYIKYTFNGKEYSVKSSEKDASNKLIFNVDNIAFNKINDKIENIVLYGTKDGILYCSNAKPYYSVSNYCYDMLSKCSGNEYENLRTLLVDLLNFGSESQKYTKYNTTNLVNANLTDEQKSYATQGREYNSVQNLSFAAIDSPTANWKQCDLILDQSLSMRFLIETDMIENINVRVTSNAGERNITANDIEFIGDGRYYIYFRDFDASEMDKTFYFTVYDGDVTVSNTISYSIESFVSQKINEGDTSLNNLLVSMMRFGDSVKKYVNS